MLNRREKIKTVSYGGMLVGMAMVLSWIEIRVAPVLPMPGMKLGLTNLMVLFVLYRVGEKQAIKMNFVRILLVGLTFGNGYSFIYSLAGGLGSGAIMIWMKKSNRFSIVMVSVGGGIVHNMGQIGVGIMILKSTSLVYYLPYLWIAGMVAGILIGILGAQIIKRVPWDIERSIG